MHQQHCNTGVANSRGRLLLFSLPIFASRSSVRSDAPAPTTKTAAGTSTRDGTDVLQESRLVTERRPRSEKLGSRAATAVLHQVSTLSQLAFRRSGHPGGVTLSCCHVAFALPRCQGIILERVFCSHLPISVAARFSLTSTSLSVVTSGKLNPRLQSLQSCAK